VGVGVDFAGGSVILGLFRFSSRGKGSGRIKGGASMG